MRYKILISEKDIDRTKNLNISNIKFVVNPAVSLISNHCSLFTPNDKFLGFYNLDDLLKAIIESRV